VICDDLRKRRTDKQAKSKRIQMKLQSKTALITGGNSGIGLATAQLFIAEGGFYAASKGGLHAMSRSMAAELAPRGIRINVVSPGFIQTPIWERQPVPADVVTALTKRLLGNVPLDRWGRAEEVAKAVLFLASDDSSYVHGSEIIVDGGLTGTMLGGQAIKVEMDAARSGQRSGQG
jgi:NAD(P)-dependent dehydrogenase (short-subunit alcohol dehydrogenase family)